MSRARHRKGTWKVCESGQRYTVAAADVPDLDEPICHLTDSWGAAGAAANAHLIAAAPELAEALERLERVARTIAGDEPSESRYGSLWGDLRAEAAGARAALAKARGES